MGRFNKDPAGCLFFIAWTFESGCILPLDRAVLALISYIKHEAEPCCQAGFAAMKGGTTNL